MSSSLVSHLARRGIEITAYGGQGPQQFTLPTWGAVLIGATIFSFFIAMGMVEYTFGRLIPTLVMIESPQDSIVFEPLPTEDTDVDASMNKTPELEVIKPRPITSSFKTTIQHLRSKGGRRASFRGFSIFFITQILVGWTAQLLSFLPFFRGLASVVATVVFAQFYLAWNHIVISEPSPKPWYRRLPARSTWRKVAAPTAIAALAESAAVYIPLYLGIAMGLGDRTAPNISQLSSHEQRMVICKGVGLFILAIILAFSLVIPAAVSLTRVQASLLSDNEETIVPFDRSFGGKVIPEIVGGTGVVGMLDAWKTFDWSARIRLVKAYAKFVAIQVALIVFFTAVVFAQLTMIIGAKDLKKIVKEKCGGATGHASLA
ncbi:hypothetical protein G7Y89_g9324 [Cudoniella acicularis]|uniref:Uncharacterized protein n=1 Tax=Cudoniella acicularis TaxID=354080 RepID=A0A8H4RH66_9HELO|nr:hypothetical protein G7Y89_g9324 [Cudoniella acicularis]